MIDLERELIQYMKDHIPVILSHLEELVAIPSVSDDREAVDLALDYMLDLGASMGFRTRAVCGHEVGIIEMGDGPETIGILGHVDVVPAGDPANWESDPFAMEVREGKAFGRGTIDDKGPMLLCLYAMKALADSGAPLHRKVQMIIGTREEVEWTDMKRFVQEQPLPDFGFTPDGEFPLCNIEKGIIDADLVVPVEGLVGADPASPVRDPAPKYTAIPIQERTDGWHVESVHAGIMENAVPAAAEAELTLWEYGIQAAKKTIRSAGKAVHSSLPENGDNAIYRLADEVQAAGGTGKLAELLMRITELFRDPSGAGAGLASTSEYYEGEFVHHNTFSVTMFHTEEGQARIHLNVRYAYGTDAELILTKLSELASKWCGHLENVDELPAVFVSRQMGFVRELIAAYEEGSGLTHEDTVAYGGSYAKAMPNIVSFGPLFPGDEDTCHEDNEYFDLASMEKCAAVYALALVKTAV